MEWNRTARNGLAQHSIQYNRPDSNIIARNIIVHIIIKQTLADYTIVESNKIKYHRI